jgi:peptidyl-prolyl cis-trans isomerase C
MRYPVLTGVIVGSAILLSGCGKKGDGGETLDKGQVVATVDGNDVTIHELNAELMGVPLPSGEKRKLVEQNALQALLGRTILANVARERKIDKSPTYILQRRRADEALLVQLLQRDIASKIAPPTREEAAKFMEANPDLFAQRKIYALDQIQFATPEDLNKLRAFEPLNTMEAVEQHLIEDRIEYRRAPGTLDSIGANPELVRKIAQLPAGEIFIVPNGGTIIASKISSTQTVPFSGEKATDYAMNLIQQKKIAEATEKELGAKIKKSQAEVKYQPGYAPAKPPAAPVLPAKTN